MSKNLQHQLYNCRNFNSDRTLAFYISIKCKFLHLLGCNAFKTAAIAEGYDVLHVIRKRHRTSYLVEQHNLDIEQIVNFNSLMLLEFGRVKISYKTK